MKQLTDFIVEIPDLVPREELRDITGWLNEVNWDDAYINKKEKDLNSRNCKTAFAWGTKYDAMLFGYVTKAFTHYNNLFSSVGAFTDSGYELLKYEPNGFYVQHVDGFSGNGRILSFSITFNDGYEGGDFSFFDGEHIVKTKAGSAIIFPSNFMYPHAITPITKGTRYSMVTWFI